MKKRKQTVTVISDNHKYSQQWYLYQNLSRFADMLQRLPDAAEVRKQQPKSVPAQMLPMVF